MKESRGLLRRIGRLRFFWLSLVIVIQTVIYVVAGMNKAYFHMDEIYSYGLANYERVQLYETEDFYDAWHDGAYYDDYLTVSEEESGDFTPVYENQKNDVHPPLFYLLLRIGMEMVGGEFSKWTGIVLNILIAAVNTVLIYMIIVGILSLGREGRDKQRVKALVLAAVIAFGVAAVSTVIYIRMYELLTMWILLTVYLHMRLLENKKKSVKLLVGIGATAFLGFLTQYYYLFFIVAMYGFWTVCYVKMKEWGKWRIYTMTLLVAGLLSLMVWPYSLQHMFFSNRGGGVIEHLLNPRLLIENIWQYLSVIDLYVFHCLLLVVLALILGLGWYMLVRQKRVTVGKSERMKLMMVLIPTMFYLVIVAAVSPFIALRYVAPVCGLILAVVALLLEKLLISIVGSEKIRKWILLGMAVVFLLMPVVLKIEPDVLYGEYVGTVEQLRERREIPVLYMFMTGNDWVVLNDLLMLREVNESYLARDIDVEEDAKRIKEILQGKDLSKGLTVFVNDGQDKEEMVELVQKMTGLKSAEKAWRMPTSEIYYLQ